MAGIMSSLWRRGRRKIGLSTLLIGVVVVVLLLTTSDLENNQLFGGVIKWRNVPDNIDYNKGNVQRKRRYPKRRDKRTEPGLSDINPAIDGNAEIQVQTRKGMSPSSEIEMSKFAAIELFSEAGCQGQSFKFNSLRSEHKCVRCFDSCRAAFPDNSPMLNGILSYRVIFKSTGRGGHSMPKAWSVSR